MEKRPIWKEPRFSATLEIIRILWNPKIQYWIYKRLPPVPILSQNNPVYDATFYFLKNHFNKIVTYAYVFQVVSFHRVSQPKPTMHLYFPDTCYVPRTFHSSLFDNSNDIWWEAQGIELQYFHTVYLYVS